MKCFLEVRRKTKEETKKNPVFELSHFYVPCDLPGFQGHHFETVRSSLGKLGHLSSV